MLQLETLRALTIMLEVEGAMNYLGMNFEILFSRKEDLIEGFKVIWFVVNNFFLSVDISGGSYILSQNTTREIGH